MKRSLSRDPHVPGPPPFRSLLVPIDLAPGSARVLGRLPLLPLAEDTQVTALHVVPAGLTARQQRSVERDAIRALADELRHPRKALPGNVTIEPLVKRGATAETIGSCATRMKAELVVMGRGSGRPLRDDFIGSTAERVIRQAKIPVLVVRLAPRLPYGRPSIAIALDEAAYEAVAVLLRVLPTPRPAVTVIHAFDAPYRSHFYPSLSETAADERRNELQLKAASEISGLLRNALARAKVLPSNAPAWKAHIRFGSPRIVVERAIERNGADLLVLGTHGYSGAPYLLLGTVAGDLLRRSTCDVLVVPPAPSRD